MKILVFNGSPKKTRSDTMHMTRAFLDGMRDAGTQDVHQIDVIDRHIEYCRGCFACKKNGGVCRHEDDMRDILKDILDRDVLLFSFPLYCYGMPAPLKNLLDRTMPLSSMAMVRRDGRYEHAAQADFSHLRYVMICGCGFPNSRQNFEPAVMQFKLCFPHSHTIITVPESPMFSAPETASVTQPCLALIRQAGAQYARGDIDAALLEQIASPMIPEDVYAHIVNGGARFERMGYSMKVVYEHKRAMTLIGFSERIRQAEGYVQCPAFWADYARRYARLWQDAEPETVQERAVLDNAIGQYALCVMDGSDRFEYVIAGEYRGGEVPEGMKLYALPESEYAVFTERGALPEALQRLNAAVWGEWLHGEGMAYDGNGDTTVEIYPAGDPKRADYECGIWVPVKKKA